jgi:hypothetical protein
VAGGLSLETVNLKRKHPWPCRYDLLLSHEIKGWCRMASAALAPCCTEYLAEYYFLGGPLLRPFCMPPVTTQLAGISATVMSNLHIRPVSKCPLSSY